MGCAISKGSMMPPGGFIKRTHHFCIHQDPLIPLPGFLVIASTRHIHSITEMEDIEYDELSKLIRATHQAVKDVTKIEYLTIVHEESSTHFHLWFFPWTNGVITQYGKPSLTKIREIMADYRKQPIDEPTWKDLEESIENIRERMAEN